MQQLYHFRNCSPLLLIYPALRSPIFSYLTATITSTNPSLALHSYPPVNLSHPPVNPSYPPVNFTHPSGRPSAACNSPYFAQSAARPIKAYYQTFAWQKACVFSQLSVIRVTRRASCVGCFYGL